MNVLEPEEQAEVLMSVSELLKPTGTAYFTVRRDLKYEGFRTHFVHKMPTYQCNVVLPYKSIFLTKIVKFTSIGISTKPITKRNTESSKDARSAT